MTLPIVFQCRSVRKSRQTKNMPNTTMRAGLQVERWDETCRHVLGVSNLELMKCDERPNRAKRLFHLGTEPLSLNRLAILHQKLLR